jgi:hypothetical protein
MLASVCGGKLYCGLEAAPNSKYGGTPPQELDASKLLMELICGVNGGIVLAATG